MPPPAPLSAYDHYAQDNIESDLEYAAYRRRLRSEAGFPTFDGRGYCTRCGSHRDDHERVRLARGPWVDVCVGDDQLAA